MAQEFISRSVGYECSVYIDDTKHYCSVAVQKETDRRYQCSVVVYGPEVSERRLTGTVSVTESLPDVFYGFQEVAAGSVEIDNLDGELNFLLDEDNRGEPIRIRRYDEANQEIHELFTGAIEGISVGDKVTLGFTSHRMDVFEQELPKHRIYTQDALTNPSQYDVEAKLSFRDATDVNEPIPIVLGEVKHLPLSLVKSDTTNYKHDYLVCEGGNVVVDQVYKNGKPSYSETGTAVGAGSGSDTIQLATTARGSRAFYLNLYIEITAGTCEGDVRLITDYDIDTKTATVDEDWSGTIDTTSQYRIREFRVYSNPSDYRRRTIIRFRYAQKENNSLIPLTADVRRFQTVNKNYLRHTEDFTHPDVASGDGGWEVPAEVTVTANSVLAPDYNLTADTLSNTAGTAKKVYQRVTYPAPSATPNLTFSVWMKCDVADSPISVDLEIDAATSGVSVTNTWTRHKITTAYSSGTTDECRISIPANSKIYVWGAQFEFADDPTWYEPVEYTNQGFRWSFPDAIKELLEDIVFGLNQYVDRSSFETANEDLEDKFLRCKGAIPSIAGRSAKAKDVLDQLMRVHGMYLRQVDGAWSLTVDKSQTSIGVLGGVGTPEQNVIDVGPLEYKSLDDTVKTVILKYALTRKDDESFDTVYAGEIQEASNSDGREEIVEHDFIRDYGTASQVAQYMAAKLQLIVKQRTVTIGQAARAVTVGKVLTLNLPRHMTENYHQYSEDLTQSSVWKNAGSSPHPTVSLVDSRNHFERGQRISRVDFPTPFVSRLDDIYQDTTVTAVADTKAIWTVWLRTHNSEVVDQRVKLKLANTTATVETKEIFPTIGRGWKKYQLVKRFSGAAGGTNIRCSIEAVPENGTGDFVLDVAASQLALEYDYQYTKTEDATSPVQELWQIIQVARQGLDRTRLTLIPYQPTLLFTVNAPDVPLAFAGDSSSYDDKDLEPDAPIDFTVPPNPPSNTVDAGVEVRPDGTTSSWGRFYMTVPFSNATKIVLQRRLSAASIWEACGEHDVLDTELGATVSILAYDFSPGLSYELRAVSINKNGLWTACTEEEWIPYGDTTGPVIVIKSGDQSGSDRLEVSQGTGRLLRVRVLLSGSSWPADLKEIRIYRATANTFPTGDDPDDPEMVVKGDYFEDSSVAVGTSYYYWARLFDLSGNYSNVIGNGNSAQTDTSTNYPKGASKNDNGSVVVGVEHTEIDSLDAGDIVTGTLKVIGGNPGSGATKIQVVEDAAAEIRFEETDTTLMGYLRAESSTSALMLCPDTGNTTYELYLGLPTQTWKEIWGIAPYIQLTSWDGADDVRLIIDRAGSEVVLEAEGDFYAGCRVTGGGSGRAYLHHAGGGNTIGVGNSSALYVSSNLRSTPGLLNRNGTYIAVRDYATDTVQGYLALFS